MMYVAFAVQGGQYRQGVSTDAAFLAANASSMEQGIQAVLTQLVQSQGKWDTLRDVQVGSNPKPLHQFCCIPCRM